MSATLADTFTSLYVTGAWNFCFFLLIAKISEFCIWAVIIGITVMIAKGTPRNTVWDKELNYRSYFTNSLYSYFKQASAFMESCFSCTFQNLEWRIMRYEVMWCCFFKTDSICWNKWNWKVKFASVLVILKLSMSAGHNDWHVRCVLSFGEGNLQERGWEHC